MEENKNIILTMECADGTTGLRELLSVFKADNGQDYAALLPLNDDETPQDGAVVELVRVKCCERADGDEDLEQDYLIEGITTDEELQTAREAFERLDFVFVDEGETNDPSVDDLPTITVKGDDGQESDWKIVDTFDCRDRMYIALIPMAEAGNDGNISIHLMRYELAEEDGVEGFRISAIPSDMEYDEAAATFEQRIGAEEA